MFQYGPKLQNDWTTDAVNIIHYINDTSSSICSSIWLHWLWFMNFIILYLAISGNIILQSHRRFWGNVIYCRVICKWVTFAITCFNKLKKKISPLRNRKSLRLWYIVVVACQCCPFWEKYLSTSWIRVHLLYLYWTATERHFILNIWLDWKKTSEWDSPFWWLVASWVTCRSCSTRVHVCYESVHTEL